MKYKFWLLSGAYKNAGDFLIRDRSISLIKEIYPDCTIKLWNRNQPLNCVMDELNTYDAIILAGGPAYQKGIYPANIPLIDNLEDIKPKICEMGLGWWSKNFSFKDILHYTFDSKMKSLLNRIMNDTGELSCRDWITAQVLKNNGYSNTVMTGCPAWYSGNIQVKTNRAYNCAFIRKICISDSTRYNNHDKLLELVQYAKNKFENAEINFIFHRGIVADTYTSDNVGKKNSELKEKLLDLGYVHIYDISYEREGFSVYDNCDLHIGYRVHAHIYNLSIHNISILIEEDSRGYGINETLGLQSLPARMFLPERDISNPYIIPIIDNYIEAMFNNKYSMFETVYNKMEEQKKIMLTHIKQFI